MKKKLKWEDLVPHDRSNIAKGLRFKENLGYITITEFEFDFIEDIITINNEYVIRFNEMICVDFKKYNK